MSSFNLFNYEIKYDYMEISSSELEKYCALVNENYSKYHLILLTLVQFIIPFLILISTSTGIFYHIYFNKAQGQLSLGIQNSSIKNKKKVA